MSEMKENFQKNAYNGLSSDFGIQIYTEEPGTAIGMMKIEDRMLNPYGAIHGGTLFALADTIGGVAAMSRGFYIVTSNGTIHYLHGTNHSREITATAREVKAGKTLSVYDVDMTDEHGTLVAKATMTYFSIGVREGSMDEVKY